MGKDAEVRREITKIIEYFTGKPVGESLDKFVTAQKIGDISGLNDSQKIFLVEVILEKFVKPWVSIGKTRLARVELLSTLGVKVDVSRLRKRVFQAKTIPGKVEIEETKAPVAVEEPENPWEITASYTPSPRRYLLEDEMRGGFIKIQKNLFKRVAEKLNEESRKNPKTRLNAINSIVTETFGQMGRGMLLHIGKSLNNHSLKHVVNKNLNAYMGGEKASESANIFVKLADMLFKKGGGEKEAVINEDQMSEELMNFFKDSNQVILRELKNKYGISDEELASDPKKTEILFGLMLYYFGLMSKEYFELTAEKVNFDELKGSEDENKIRLMTAIMYDCLHSSMNKEEAEQAYKYVKRLLKI
jgi:hypothetical protein